MAGSEAGQGQSQRVDVWLWFARIAKSRTLAQALIARGKVRINRTRIGKSSQVVKPGDVITVALGPRVRVLQVAGCGDRRGPAVEATRLYVELTAMSNATKSGIGETIAKEPLAPPSAVRDPGSGRPTKRDRRAIERLKG